MFLRDIQAVPDQKWQIQVVYECEHCGKEHSSIEIGNSEVINEITSKYEKSAISLACPACNRQKSIYLIYHICDSEDYRSEWLDSVYENRDKALEVMKKHDEDKKDELDSLRQLNSYERLGMIDPSPHSYRLQERKFEEYCFLLKYYPNGTHIKETERDIAPQKVKSKIESITEIQELYNYLSGSPVLNMPDIPTTPLFEHTFEIENGQESTEVIEYFRLWEFMYQFREIIDQKHLSMLENHSAHIKYLELKHKQSIELWNKKYQEVCQELKDCKAQKKEGD